MPENSLSADLALIRDAAAEAASIAMRYFRKEPEVFWKGASPVTEADYAVDRFLRETLTAARPGYGWLSEETADSSDRLGAARTFVVDPIDGTRAFMEGRDIWCVSIAVIEAGRPIVGVLDCPAMKEVYLACKGAGASLNGAPLSRPAPAARPVIAGPDRMIKALPGPLRARLREHAYVPSLAYRIAMVAAGRIDASFVKENAHDWDLAAADLILQETGGSILGVEGVAPVYGQADTRHGKLAAGRGELLGTLVGALGDMG